MKEENHQMKHKIKEYKKQEQREKKR